MKNAVAALGKGDPGGVFSIQTEQLEVGLDLGHCYRAGESDSKYQDAVAPRNFNSTHEGDALGASGGGEDSHALMCKEGYFVAGFGLFVFVSRGLYQPASPVICCTL